MRRNRGRAIRLLAGAAVLACGSTVVTPAVADPQPTGDQSRILVYPGTAVTPMSGYDYHGILPDGNGNHVALRNPHRGLRLELAFNAGDLTSATFTAGADRPSTPLVENVGTEVATQLGRIDELFPEGFGADTKVAQVYFYLHRYVGQSIPTTAINNMQSVFDQLRALGYTVVLRFAYARINSTEVNDPKGRVCTSTDPAHRLYQYDLDDILRHLDDIKADGLLTRNAGLITSWEAGFLGAWGEWGPHCSEIQKNQESVRTLMSKILSTAPTGVPVIMRYPWHRDMVAESIRGPIGFHNDYFAAGYAYRLNEAGERTLNFDVYNPRREVYAGVVNVAPSVMVDGEMAWNEDLKSVPPTCPQEPPAADALYHPNIGLHAIVSAQRLQSMHYTTFSAWHNLETFKCWRDRSITRPDVAGAGLPADAAYFGNSDEHQVSAFDYIRDHLGYRLRLQRADFDPTADDRLSVKLQVANDGFSAPHIPRRAYLVLLDTTGEKVREQVLDADWRGWRGLCSTEDQVDGQWATRTTNTSCEGDDEVYPVEGEVDVAGLPAGTYQLGLWLPDDHPNLRENAKYAVRLANEDVTWSVDADGNPLDGVNVFAGVHVTNSAPSAPGSPAVSLGSNPNTGEFTLGWPPATDPDGDAVTYSLQHKDADDAEFSEVAAGLSAASYSFSASAPEGEGTWTYRVRASDSRSSTGAFSPLGGPVVVDRSAPTAPSLTVTAGQTAHPVAGVDWYRDQVSVTVTPQGDPALADTSPGSGVDDASYTSPFTVATNGASTLTQTVRDLAGNTSVASAPLAVHVDATAPIMRLTACPTEVIQGSPADAEVSASDAESGLAADPSGTHPLDTAIVGPQSRSFRAVDGVGHITEQVCSYRVIYDFRGFVPPVVNFSTDTPTVNTVAAGSSVSVRFSLGGDQGTDIFAAGHPQSVKLADCRAASLTPPVDNGAPTGAAPGALLYDAGTGQYNYVWRTRADWAGTCRQLVFTLNDGTAHRANFRFR